MERKAWGVVEGQSVELFSLDLGGGVRAKITNFGGAIVSVEVPDRHGIPGDVVLGYDSVEDYVKCTSSLGVLVGRYANRIEGAEFTLGGTTYKLAANDGRNHLHGGPRGFGKVVWEPTVVQTEFGEGLQLAYLSPHGEEGYPGNLKVQVTYAPTAQGGGLRIDYQAETDQDTIVNLTNHAYFNLAGRGSHSILDHELELRANFFTPINAEGIPTGEILKVEGTPLDFRRKKEIGLDIDADHEQIRAGRGYDHNWVLNDGGSGLIRAARVDHPFSGRSLEVWTTKPGIQFYTGNFLNSTRHPYRSGLCLETQFFPNSPRIAHFPSALLRAGEVYQHTTIYDFAPKGTA